MAHEMVNDDLVTVDVQVNAVDAQVMKSMLESYGIPVILDSDTITNPAIRTINVGSMGEIRLKVPASQAEEAANLLSALKDSLPTASGPPSLWRRKEASEADSVAGRGDEKTDDRSFRLVMAVVITTLILLAVWALWSNWPMA